MDLRVEFLRFQIYIVLDFNILRSITFILWCGGLVKCIMRSDGARNYKNNVSIFIVVALRFICITDCFYRSKLNDIIVYILL